jgi:phage gp37-like protein
MKQTTKKMVVETILNSRKAKVGRKTYNVLRHQEILNLSKSEDSATRRLREMANQYNDQAYEIKDGQYLIEPSFVKWLKKNY